MWGGDLELVLSLLYLTCPPSFQVFNCPNLKEVSLEFSSQENDNTDLTAMADNLGRSCPRLQNIHIASIRLSHAAVLALTAANLRFVKCYIMWLIFHFSFFQSLEST